MISPRLTRRVTVLSDTPRNSAISARLRHVFSLNLKTLSFIDRLVRECVVSFVDARKNATSTGLTQKEQWCTIVHMSDERDSGRAVGVRIPDEMLDDLEELRPLLQKLPEYQASTLSRSALIRVAIAHGLQRLRALLKERLPEAEQVDLLAPKQQSLDD